jgi:NTP pyrophosphatase (non-canonical NTP hydrolase)
MDLREYQIKSKDTDQRPGSDKLINFLIPILGLVGEMGSTISEFKKRLRDGKSYREFKPHLEEELGDVLWYLSNIATKMDLDLESIAQKNIEKTQNRWKLNGGASYYRWVQSNRTGYAYAVFLSES